MNIIVITPPLVEPVTAAQAFVHLRLDSSDEPEQNPDYAAVLAQITSAREQCEQITRRAFVQQTLRIVGPGDGSGRSWFWWGNTASARGVELLRPPLISVAAVRYYDSSNTLQTVDPGAYFVTDDLVPQLHFADGFSAPCVYRRPDALQIEYVAGYAPVVTGADTDYRANIPESIKQAILIGVQLQYDELTPDKRKSLESARDSLLSSYRINTF